MSTSREKYYKALFLIAAIYDILLGIIFTFFYRFAFQFLGIAEKMPQHGAYISLIGAFLLVIGVAYALIFVGDLQRNRDLITVGVLYKLAYCAIALYYFAVGQVPHMVFVTLFGIADFVFLVLMAECRLFLRRTGSD